MKHRCHPKVGEQMRRPSHHGSVKIHDPERSTHFTVSISVGKDSLYVYDDPSSHCS